MSPGHAALIVELTRDLSQARAEAHSFRELLVLTLELYGASQREAKRQAQAIAALLTRLRDAERVHGRKVAA